QDEVLRGPGDRVQQAEAGAGGAAVHGQRDRVRGRRRGAGPEAAPGDVVRLGPPVPDQGQRNADRVPEPEGPRFRRDAPGRRPGWAAAGTGWAAAGAGWATAGAGDAPEAR